MKILVSNGCTAALVAFLGASDHKLQAAAAGAIQSIVRVCRKNGRYSFKNSNYLSSLLPNFLRVFNVKEKKV